MKLCYFAVIIILIIYDNRYSFVTRHKRIMVNNMCLYIYVNYQLLILKREMETEIFLLYHTPTIEI